MSITPTKKPVETQRTSTALETYRFLGEGKDVASLKQIRAAFSLAYKHWDLKNPFAKIEPPLQKEPQIRYLLLSEIRRLLDYLKSGGRATAPPSRST
jgi:integrase